MTGSRNTVDSSVIRGTAWVALGQGGSNVAALCATLALARVLQPSDFGVFALAASVVFPVLLFSGGGIGAALVHRRSELGPAAASALAYSVLSSIVVYGTVFALAPLLAAAFDTPELTGVLRVLALVIPLRALFVVPAGILDRRRDFRTRALCEICAAGAQVGTALALGFSGHGVWSLVLGHVAGTAALVPLGWLGARHVPNPRLVSWKVARELAGYSSFVGGTNLAHVLNATVPTLIVGQQIGPAATGIFTVAHRIASVPSTVVGQVLRTATFPVYCAYRHDIASCRGIFTRNLQRLGLVVAPLSVALLVATEPLVRLLLGERWLETTTPLRILAVFGLIHAITTSCEEVLKAFGRPRLSFGLGLARLATAAALVALLVPPFGLTGAAAGVLLASCATAIPTFTVTVRLLRIDPLDLGRALIPCVACLAPLALTLTLVEPSSPALLLVATAVYAACAALFARALLRPVWIEVRRGWAPGRAR